MGQPSPSTLETWKSQGRTIAWSMALHLCRGEGTSIWEVLTRAMSRWAPRMPSSENKSRSKGRIWGCTCRLYSLSQVSIQWQSLNPVSASTTSFATQSEARCKTQWESRTERNGSWTKRMDARREDASAAITGRDQLATDNVKAPNRTIYRPSVHSATLTCSQSGPLLSKSSPNFQFK